MASFVKKRIQSTQEIDALLNYEMEIAPERTVIFAHARSGSTTLYRVLQLHPQMNVALEPFWHGYAKENPGERNYVDFIDDVPSLEKALDDLFAKYNGIKILSYQLPEKLYTHLLLSPDVTVIFLQRANLLRAEVSGCIAEQTKVWQISDLNEETGHIYRSLKPVSLKKIEDGLEYAKELRGCYNSVIERRATGTYRKVYYENLYTGDLGANHAAAREIFDFLGLDLPRCEELDNHLDPRTSKINTPESYALLPNSNEINERFGNDDTGWLFGDDDVGAVVKARV
ncbi:MAG: hypothetical protein OXR72_19365 [Gemmatimonadota bacterium]|nr:hypothetical protein [Gemmatimonadota bacterium]